MSSTATLQKLEFRCCRCFYSLYAAVDEAGTKKACQYCGTENVVPEATPERIARAENVSDDVLKPSTQPLLLRDEQFSDEELRQEVKRQMYVPPNEMRVMSGVSSSRLKRFFGFVIDNVLMGLAFAAGAMLLGNLVSYGFFSREALQSKEWTLDRINATGVMLFPVIALLLFQWNLISSRGQTIAKMLLGMKIVTDSGHSPGLFQGVILRNWLRNLLGIIPLFTLIDALFIFGDAHRCVHDYIAGTYVVDAY